MKSAQDLVEEVLNGTTVAEAVDEICEIRQKEYGIRPLKSHYNKYILPHLTDIIRGGKPEESTFAGTKGIGQFELYWSGVPGMPASSMNLRRRRRWFVSLYPKGGLVKRPNIIFNVGQEMMAKVFIDEPGFEKKLTAAAKQMVKQVKRLDKIRAKEGSPYDR